jgi:hypothetical protein
MKLYEAIFCGLVTYAGVAGFLWFYTQSVTALPKELRNPGFERYRPLIYFDRLTPHGRISVICAGLSMAVMIGGMILLFSVATSIPWPATHAVAATQAVHS